MEQESVAAAASRLNAVGITCVPHTWREQARYKFADPRNPIRWVDYRGILLTFTGQPDSPAGEDVHEVSVRLDASMLAVVTENLTAMCTDPTVTLTLSTHTSGMVMFGAVNDRVVLTVSGARWERFMFGGYRQSFTPELLADLRLCLEAEAVLLALHGDTAAG